MKILETRPLELAQVSEIILLDEICLGGLWTEEGYLREINSPNSDLLTLKLIPNQALESNQQTFGTMVGMGCLWSIVEEAHITLLGVHPDYRRQKFGTLLLLSLLENAIARQLEWATLEVNVNNSKAINLYQKFGFRVVGRRKGYYQATGEDATILWLKDLQKPDFHSRLTQWQQDLIVHLGNNNYCWRQS